MTGAPATEMLDRFLRLRTDRQFERFALSFGVLELCAHGWPAAHSNSLPYLEDTPAATEGSACAAVAFADGELIDDWAALQGPRARDAEGRDRG